MEIFGTIITGVFIYVLGQFTLKIIIEPIQDLKKEIQQILNDCSYYAGTLTNMPNTNEEKVLSLRDTFRKRSTSLRSKYKIIPYIDFFSYLKIIPTAQNLSEVSSSLMGISNTISSDGAFKNNLQNGEWLTKIEELLTPNYGE